MLPWGNEVWHLRSTACVMEKYYTGTFISYGLEDKQLWGERERKRERGERWRREKGRERERERDGGH